MNLIYKSTCPAWILWRSLDQTADVTKYANIDSSDGHSLVKSYSYKEYTTLKEKKL